MPTEQRDGATARPWSRIAGDGRIHGDGKLVALLMGAGFIPVEEIEANGDLMVTAVNDHSALVEKMRALAAKWEERVENRHNEQHGYESCISCQDVLNCRDELLRALGEGHE